MPSHALDQRLFEKTDSLTSESNGASAVGGIELIDGWLRVVADNTSTQLVDEKLRALRDQLTLDQPDADLVRELLLSLADHTSQVSQGSNTQEQTASQLEGLATTLRQLAGS